MKKETGKDRLASRYASVILAIHEAYVPASQRTHFVETGPVAHAGFFEPWKPPKDLFVAPMDDEFRKSLTAGNALSAGIRMPLPLASLGSESGRLKLHNALTRTKLAESERPVALIDLTFLGNAAKHILFTDRSIRARGDGIVVEVPIDSLFGAELKTLDAQESRLGPALMIGDARIPTWHSDVSEGDLFEIVSTIAALCVERERTARR